LRAKQSTGTNTPPLALEKIFEPWLAKATEMLENCH